MLRIAANLCIYICATLLAAKCVLGQFQQQQHHHHHQKPWPTYSLQNMPQTRFTCHDKILGGYYADAETQCQMFHVCVKVAGGVQDFRFLCPNSTAFDQEAQICADWGDVDCEQSVLYYGSDNFDLYRLGSGFESKRAPLAEEEEATFHLQRAESADTRRSKETRVDQKLRPDQPPNYTKHFAATTRNPDNYANLAAQRNPQKNNYNNYHGNNNNGDAEYDVKRLPEAVTKQPIVNYYTPTTTTTTTSTKKPSTTTSTERYTDESKQDFDDIFKGSHSSNFFANRNGGREDDFHDHSTKTKYNDFNDYSAKNIAETSTTGKTRVQPTRGHSRRIHKAQSASTSTITTTTQNTTPSTKTTKKLSQQTYNQNSDISGITQYNKLTTSKPVKSSTVSSTARPFDSNSNFNYRSNYNAHDYNTQDNIQPTTYNPNNNAYRLKTTTPKYTELAGGTQEGALQKPSKSKTSKDHYEVPTGFGKNGSVQSRRKSHNHALSFPQNSTFVNHKEFSEFAKIPNTQEPQPFQPAKVFRPPPISKDKEYQKTAFNQTELRSRSRSQPVKSRDYQEPSPFSAVNHNQRSKSTTQSKLKLTTSTSPSPPVSHQQPRGFASRGRINYKATTQRGDFDNYNIYYTPTSNAPKKFSTLVPKEQTFQPTTFKPTTYKKAYENTFFESQQKQLQQKQQLTGRPLLISTTQLPTTTADPFSNPDEDDGQYHPELYEQDFPKNKLKLQRTTTSAPTTTTSKPTHYPQSHLKTQQLSFFQKQQQQQRHETASDSGDLSDEDELFKTAHSLNFGAASINKLRADILKAEKTSQQYNAQYALNQQSTSPPTGSPSYLPTTSTSSYSYPTYAPTSTTYSNTHKPITAFTTQPSTTSLKTTIRPITTTTTIRTPFNTQAPTAVTAKSHHKSSGKKSSGKHKKTHKSKRPPHADEDTSYDYAYYDSDTLSESPQEYPEYEISEFTKTRKN